MLNSDNIRFSVPEGKRILLFLCISILCYVIANVIIALIHGGELTAAKIRISILVQDIVLFLLPSLITAMMITRRPADFLMLSNFPKILPIILTITLVMVMVPFMNKLVMWNENFQLPDSMHGIQQTLRNWEDSATLQTQKLMAGDNIGSLIISILIIGILAGFSEELYFRGTLQRLISTSGIGIHLAIWITAFIFSAVHLQIFGFIPRLLLGALFGYLMWWSRSVWLAIIAHVTNNTMVVIALRFNSSSLDVNNIGALESTEHTFAFWFSFIGTIIWISAIYLICKNDRKNINQSVCEKK